MAAFQAPVNVANRGLQHCGVPQLDLVQGFSQPSKAARETSSCYDGLRRAELRANVWKFATRKAALRPIDSNTLLLSPALWVSTTTYFVGSIVADAANNLWISRIPNNTGNPPVTASGTVTTPFWEPYFGPLTVELYDSSQTYFTGELVYTAAGDGTVNVYLSLMSGNPIHPALPNQWSTQTTYFRNQVVQTWPAWAVGTTYNQGQTVKYTDGNVYASLVNGNLGNAPSMNPVAWALVPVLTIASQPVPSSTMVSAFPNTSPVLEWAQASTYAPGNVVMFNGIEYLSLVANNTGNFPNSAGSTSWVALSGATLSMSLIDLNIGNNPANSPALWAVGTTYASGNKVAGSDGVVYSSVGNGNVGNNPVTDGGVHWTNTVVLDAWGTVFTQGGGNDMWMQIGGASFPTGVGLADLNISWPIGAGPAWQTWNLNVYWLPAGYLRRAPQDPAAGRFSWLGAPSSRMADDWVYQGDYMTTELSIPIVFRFVAEFTDVSRMDDQFCEMLGAKIGAEVCETLTQSSAKVAACIAAYKAAEFKAKAANAIEMGSEEPALDDWIACRA